MLHESFYWLLNMSVAGTLAGGAVWLLRRWKRLPRRLAHGLWSVAGLRLMLPFGLASGVSILRLMPQGWYRSVPLSSDLPVTMTNVFQQAETYAPFALRTQRLTALFTLGGAVWLAALFTLGGAVWLAGLLTLLAIVAVTVFRNAREARRAVPLREDVYLSDRVDSPAVYGVLRPRILIPADMAGADLSLILAHERVHIRRRENLWRLLAMLIACVHWFNPAVWWFLGRFLSDAELACDESVLARLPDSHRKAYARALVDAAERRLTLASAFGGASLKARVLHALSFRRMSAGAAVACVLFALAFAWVFLTNTP